MRQLILVVFSIISIPVMADPFDVYGTYLLEDKNSKVNIEDCGNATPCGRIIWINPETIKEGFTQETIKGKSGELILGMQILKDFKRKSKDWRGGTIHDPGKDKTYASRLKRLNNGTLQVKGCISFLCQTQIWTRVDAQ